MSESARELLPFIEETARAAGAVHMRHFRNLAGYEEKGANNLVTVADREAEDEIARRIRARFPDHSLMLEETGGAAAENTWIVDPLDGTTNFAHGMNIFAVSIGFVHRGVPMAGGIFAPALGDYYFAARGEGAWRNGDQRMHVSRPRTLGDALLVTGFPYDRRVMLDPLMDMMKEALRHSHGVLRLGAAALDIAAVAAGDLDGFYEYNLMPWDVAAGAVMIEEAGGRITDFTGGVYDVFHPLTTVASNGHVHDELMLRVTRPFVEEIMRRRNAPA